MNPARAQADFRPDVEGFVLAGGESRRMGRDKALVQLEGKPLVEWALDVLRRAGLAARIAGARSKLTGFAQVVADEYPEAGPLGAVCTALLHATAEWAVFLPVDLPLMAPALIEYLVMHARVTGRAVTLASLNGYAQTFPSVVRRDALPALEGELRARRMGCFGAFEKAGVSVLPAEIVAQGWQASDERGRPVYQFFWNVNTPEDLARHESRIGPILQADRSGSVS